MFTKSRTNQIEAMQEAKLQISEQMEEHGRGISKTAVQHLHSTKTSTLQGMIGS